MLTPKLAGSLAQRFSSLSDNIITLKTCEMNIMCFDWIRIQKLCVVNYNMQFSSTFWCFIYIAYSFNRDNTNKLIDWK